MREGTMPRRLATLLRCLLWLASIALAAAPGLACSELRGRKKIQEGTDAYHAGDFPGAVARFTEATAYVPAMPLVWLNRGYACRELIIPDAPAAVNRDA